MKHKQISIICSVILVLAAGIFGLNSVDFTIENDVEVKQQNPSVSPEPRSDEKTESVSFNFGTSMAESEIGQKSSLTPVAFRDASKAKLGQNSIVLLDTRVRDNGDLYYVYGPPTLEINDQTLVSDIYQSGALQIRITKLNNPENSFDALANYFKDEVKFVNGVPTLIDEYSDGYQLKMYPGDNRKITIGAKTSLEELKSLAIQLGIENKGLNLNAYVVKNWEIPQEPPLSYEGISEEP